MSKLTKISGITGSLILIFLDLWVIFNSFTLSGILAFSNIVINMIPCGLLLGALTLYVIYNSSPKKVLSVTTLVVFSITAVIKMLTLVLYALERIYATYLSPMSANDYLDLAEFSAYGLLSAAVVFLMIYLIKGKLEKTSLALAGISAFVLCVIWVINIYSLITDAVNLSSGIFEVVISFFKGGLAKDIVIILAYLSVFWVLASIIKNKEKA